MKWFIHSQSDLWHQNVDAAVGRERPCLADGTINPIFPWGSLRTYTDTFLKKKKDVSSMDQEVRLVGLVCQHKATIIALAACAHGLSTKAIVACLTGDYGRLPELHTELSFYLQAIIVINYVNPTAVTAADVKLAKALLPLCTIPAADALQVATKLWISGIPKQSLLVDEISTVTRNSCRDFKTHLNALVSRSEWSQAAKDTSWLSQMSDSMTRNPSENKLNRILTKEFPQWRAWAAWRPNSIRLRLWEKIMSEQRDHLRGILALEGPDFCCNVHQTLKDHITALPAAGSDLKITIDSLRFDMNASWNEQVDLISRLLYAVDDACSSSKEEVILLIHLTQQNLNDEQLRIFEAVHKLGSASTTETVVAALQPSPKPSALLPLLPALASPAATNLRSVLRQHLTNQLTLRFHNLQATLATHLLEGLALGAEGLEKIEELQQLGQAMRDAEWVLSLLKPNNQVLLKNWPNLKLVNAWHMLWEAAAECRNKFVQSNLNSYFIHHFIRPLTFGSNFAIVDSLITAWTNLEVTSSKGRSQLSLHIAASASTGIAFRCICISQIPAMTDTFANDLLAILSTCQENPVQAILRMAHLIASCSNVEVGRSWRIVLVRLIEQQGPHLIQKLLEDLSAKSWIELLECLRSIFLDDPKWDDNATHPLLQPPLQEWGHCLKQRLQTLRNVELSLDKGPALKCILLGMEGPVVLNILDALAVPIIGGSGLTAVQKEIMGLLAEDGGNAETIYKAVCYMGSMSTEGYNACAHVIERHGEILPPTADIVLAGYLHSTDIPDGDKSTIRAVGDALGLDINECNMPSSFSLELTDQYISEEIEELLQEAKRLESLRLAFKALEPEETHDLLLEIGIEDSSLLDDMLVGLPPDVVDVVERINDSTLEIQLPLTQLTTFVRQSMGAPNANNIIVRLHISETGFGFCIHFDDALEQAPPNALHVPCFISDDASSSDSSICDMRATPALVHLTVTLFRYLKASSRSIVEIERTMASAIGNLFQTCIVCGSSHTARLNRSSPCSSADCQSEFLKSTLEVSLSDVRQDPAVVDLLVTATYAASLVKNPDLLPGSPVQDMAAVQEAMNSLPPISDWQTNNSLEDAINPLGSQTKKLLIWIMTAFKGYLVSATGSLKIPSLPGTHQFFLANTNPEKEREFTDRINAGHPRKVLFHATTVQRLYSILCQGLREMSGTSLQRNGASFGNGIYMAEEPLTAWGYTETFINNWKSSQFSNFRVMLGCEYVGTSPSVSRNIYVIKEPAALMLRYIFILPANAQMPVARHLVPAMESVFTNLRAGAI